LRRGVSPLVSKVKGLLDTYSARLFEGTVPDVGGVYQIIVGLVPEGVRPSVARAIPGYIDQKTATVR